MKDWRNCTNRATPEQIITAPANDMWRTFVKDNPRLKLVVCQSIMRPIEKIFERDTLDQNPLPQERHTCGS